MAANKGTPIGRAINLGSAHHGVQHWLRQRAASGFNLFLGLWLVFSLLMLPDLGYATLRDWMDGPIPPIALGLLAITAAWETRLGLQVVIEDYLKGADKVAALSLLHLFAAGVTASGLYLVVRLIADSR
ncbi:MAG: sdhD [Novosphingobium lindaniclasticum]|jgi:succinate dehydrogenase / fumarate reductase membrane anchor subunit|uniref:Succinate dehydrogenase hydrophobic membrane anchor subunit n=1 Tax=Novosphingobium lindaniclasticum LE124 TaxID=1096930 RepID=T0J4U0_9SPHN|nr:succinate dehydrogenase, hydrophobic membrane anchor protein [Novosphingobium lindaniclasticum]EQB19165.1 hypothetical protein L284_02720 [Novosphingobium lindaniclasticum LE124]MDF2639214.1 sdhD [Novosphingobium lindaniclasticum]